MTAIQSNDLTPIVVNPAFSLRSSTTETRQEAQTLPAALGKDEAQFSTEAKERAENESKEDRDHGPKQESELSDSEKKEVAQLKARDAEVRAHEQAHISALGGGAANYEQTTGPDGRRYVTGGEVPVSIGESSAGPEATIRQAQKVARAAVAPAQPSAADHAARAKALQVEAKARKELKDEGDDQEIRKTIPREGETDGNGHTEPAHSILNQPSDSPSS